VILEAVPKLQFLEQLPIKIVVLQAIGRKTTRACDKITDFGIGSLVNFRLRTIFMSTRFLYIGF